MIELNTKQKEGLAIAIDRYKSGKKYTVICGYAGTGKSTLVRFIIDALKKEGIKEDEVVYTSFTGKATQVLQKKGNKNVSTLHKLLYDSFPRANGTFYRMPKSSIGYKIVVVDEVSMVPMDLMKLLATHDAYVICLGDSYQLPPIYKDQDNHLLDSPHVFLDEIQRQAAESEIIQLTMKIRNGEEIPYFKGKDVQVISRDELNTGMLLWADQILVAKNETRNNVNNTMRELLGRGEKPEDGDKVICLRNYWDCESDKNSALINGAIGYLKNSYETFEVIPAKLNWGTSKEVGLINANFISDTGEDYGSLMMDKKLILEGEYSLSNRLAYKLNKNMGTQHLVPMEFAYGYAITCHKSQGSEWSKVLVVEEKFPFNEEEHRRWLYTACTRSSEKLVLVKE